MNIDVAGGDVKAIHIDGFESILCIKMLSDRRYLAVFNTDIAHGVDLVLVVENMTTPEQQIVWQ
jgi:hypothetical protein